MISMKELALLANTSTATVSRVFHSPHLVRPETREFILRLAEEHGYVYNAAAGDLSRNRSTVIGVLIPTTVRSLFGNSILAIQDKTQEKEFSIIIGNTQYDEGTERRILQQFLERRVAGLILTGFSFRQEEFINYLINIGIPIVIIWEKLDKKDVNYVGFDNFQAAFDMTEYLISLKHRRLGLIIGPFSKIGRTKKRCDGYKAAVEKHGLPDDPSLVVECDLDFIEGKHAMLKLLALPERPTAVFAASDTLAIGALAAVKEMGLRVPQDVSLAGFDDIDFAAYCDPPLTTVRVPAYKMGQIAVKILLEIIEKKTTEVQQYCLETDLIIRKSCSDFKDGPVDRSPRS